MVFPQEVFNLPLVLLGQQRTGRVDEPAAGFDHARRALKNAFLQGDERRNSGAELPPALVRVAPPGSRAGAGRVDEDEVEVALMALDVLVALARQLPRLDVVQPGAAEPLLRAHQ